MSDIVSDCYKRWQCRAMEIELAQANAKLVEQAQEIDRLRAALHRISLGSQNSSHSKEALGREARAALGGEHE